METALDHVENHAADLVKHSATHRNLSWTIWRQVLDPEERAALALDLDDPPAGTLMGEPLPQGILPEPATNSGGEPGINGRNGKHAEAPRRLNAEVAAVPTSKRSPQPQVSSSAEFAGRRDAADQG